MGNPQRMATKAPSLNWSKASVSEESRLTVPVNAPGAIDETIWLDAVKFVAEVRNNEVRRATSWAAVEFDAAEAAIIVDAVESGAEDELKEALDGLVSSAHTVATRAQEVADQETDDEPDDDPADVAKEMQKRFRSGG